MFIDNGDARRESSNSVRISTIEISTLYDFRRHLIVKFIADGGATRLAAALKSQLVTDCEVVHLVSHGKCQDAALCSSIHPPRSPHTGRLYEGSIHLDYTDNYRRLLWHNGSSHGTRWARRRRSHGSTSPARLPGSRWSCPGP